MLTLWDLVKPVADVFRELAPPASTSASIAPLTHADKPSVRRRKPRLRPPAPAIEPAPCAHPPGEDIYERVTRTMLQTHDVRVRKWRRSMSGVAWQIRCADGSTIRLIEAPKPKSPISAAVFLHEVGHHVIGFDRYKPRCLEEYHAWDWAVTQMTAMGVPINESVTHRVADSLWYAVYKARRRGLKDLPPELEGYTQRPPPLRERKV